jgi:hypothetical protein
VCEGAPWLALDSPSFLTAVTSNRYTEALGQARGIQVNPRKTESKPGATDSAMGARAKINECD